MAVAEGPQLNPVPILAQSDGGGGVHASVLRGVLHGIRTGGPLSAGLGGDHPERPFPFEQGARIHDGVGELVLIVPIAPPDDHAIDAGVVLLVDQVLTGQALNGLTDGIIDIIIPQPLLDHVPGLES